MKYIVYDEGANIEEIVKIIKNVTNVIGTTNEILIKYLTNENNSQKQVKKEFEKKLNNSRTKLLKKLIKSSKSNIISDTNIMI